MAKHLGACGAYREAVAAADQAGGKPGSIFHLYVQEARHGDYWLHLEMAGRAKLGDLDDYLRAIWLECCGHHSCFRPGGWRSEDVPMHLAANQVFQAGRELMHIYDYGSTSETIVRVIGERRGRPLTGNPIYLMARNRPPEDSCMECGRPAKWLCLECLYEHAVEGTLCDDHAKEHPHQDYGDPVPLVNSPRVGMCGYVGPAKPPY